MASAPMTYSQFVALTDKVTAQWLAVQMMAATAASKGTDLDNLVAAYTDYGLRGSLSGATHSPTAFLALNAISKAGYRQFLLGLKYALRSSGVALAVSSIIDIDTFATYYNYGAGGPVNALLNPSFSALYGAVNGATVLSAKNVFSPAVPTMATWVQGTGFTAGTAVTTTLYGGCATLSAVVTGWSGAGGTCTFAVTGLNSAGSVVTDNWTVTIAANGTYAPTGSVVKLVQTVTAITPTSMTAGTIVVSGGIPAGRTNPPT